MPTLYPFRDPVLQNLNRQLEVHFTDNSLTVNRLLKLVGASRTDLHRKLKRATGLSVSAYIRRLRLHYSATLLIEQPHWSLYQVTLEAGFESQSYFTRAFKAEFGVCPSTYRAAALAGDWNLEHGD